MEKKRSELKTIRMSLELQDALKEASDQWKVPQAKIVADALHAKLKAGADEDAGLSQKDMDYIKKAKKLFREGEPESIADLRRSIDRWVELDDFRKARSSS